MIVRQVGAYAADETHRLDLVLGQYFDGLLSNGFGC